MKIILDTNFLIYCAREKLDYVEAVRDLLNEKYELVVPKQVIKELEGLRDDKLKKVKGEDKDAAGLALQIIGWNGVEKVDVKGKSVDDAIVKLAKSDAKNIVCTLDKEMRWSLGRVILINKGKRLMLTR